MSLNQVLNRPLFRNKALSKGHLQPVKANTGRMIGQHGGIDYVQKPSGGFYDPQTGRIVGGLPAVVNQPPTQKWYNPKRLGSELKNLPQGIKQILNPKGALPATYGTGRFAPALLGYEGVYDLVSRFTGSPILKPSGEGMEEGGAKLATDMGITALLTMNPYTAVPARAIGLGWTGLRLGKNFIYDPVKESLVKYTNMSDAEKYAVQNDISAEASMEDIDTMGYADDKTDTKKYVSSEGKGLSARTKEDAVVADDLTESKNLAKKDDDLVDIAKVIDNNSDTITPPEIMGAGTFPTPPELMAKKMPPKKVTSGAETKKITKAEPDASYNVKTKNGSPITNKAIETARIYFDEARKGQSSQAKLVFLANMAAGLMSGTTMKSGIGGALEVLGQALGPAVNNYATMKLKENELDNALWESALTSAFEEMSLYNEAMTSDFDGTHGVIQVRGADGILRNYKGRQKKDGTYELSKGGLDASGQQQYVPVPYGQPIEGFGTAFNYYEQEKIDDDLFKLGDELSSRYKTFRVTNDILKILDRVDIETGKKVEGGVAASVDILTKRLGGVFKGLIPGQSVDKAAELAEGAYQTQKKYIEEQLKLTQDKGERAQLKRDLNELKPDTIKKRIKSELGRTFSGLTGAELEQLAVQEVTLVYAMANSFKDKDRLTARDIKAAEKIVNIFSFARGSQDVMDSIKAIARELEEDILRYENDYRRKGGLEVTIEDFRRTNNFQTNTRQQNILEELLKTMSLEDKVKIMEGVQLQ